MIGVVLLAHEQPRRTAELARHMAQQGCVVAIHVDARATDTQMADLMALVGGQSNIVWAPRRRCDWGMFSLVEASLDCLRLLFDRWPEITHVCQLSGACLPIKPIAALFSHLERHRDVDFIEAVSIAEDNWVVDGLSVERFTLYHPLSWRRRRWLFDRNVGLQRLLRVRRKMPPGLVPHIGSQWWCLSRRTLDLILQDPNLPTYCRYFKTTWIPDESFFQTLAAHHSQRITSAPLHYVRFDPQGKPYVFYDDHAELLKHADGFFARKIWRGAQKLYDTFLDPNLAANMPRYSSDDPLNQRFEEAKLRHTKGRAGLISQARHPGRYRKRAFDTARDYVVFDGLVEVLPNLTDELNAKPGVISHVRLFHPARVEFVRGADQITGNLPANPAVRDYSPVHFLSKMIWAERAKLQCFAHEFGGNDPVDAFLRLDPNARIIWLEDIWLLRLFRDANGDPTQAAGHLAAARRKARQVRDAMASTHNNAVILGLSLADVLTGRMDIATHITAALPAEIKDPGLFSSVNIPEGFGAFLQDLAPEDALAALSDAVTAHERVRRMLRRKT